ncbi:hypothetical protein [Paenibacillus arenilitoris]|uniref:Uncharacterized protein n=1 Tax=Paenibacillus arenilitoris TaxID=2772299 RepID=A0A927CS51_9BACL|nr:hypothetical protein [Paenibacillus arenilitoris]MBD2871221.1 hypothetical protein [Paenibacillus arenilitoris]
MINDLSIGSGKIVFNNFPENVEFNTPEAYEELKEDLIQIVYSNRFLIDVGWYPSFQENGQFTLFLIENNDWEKPVFKKRTRSIKVVREIIEEYAAYIDSQLK